MREMSFLLLLQSSGSIRKKKQQREAFQKVTTLRRIGNFFVITTLELLMG